MSFLASLDQFSFLFLLGTNREAAAIQRKSCWTQEEKKFWAEQRTEREIYGEKKLNTVIAWTPFGF